jgi:hypothetical protein
VIQPARDPVATVVVADDAACLRVDVVAALVRIEFIQRSDDDLKPSRFSSLLGALRITPASESPADHRH